MILNERFKSPNKEFEKVFSLFRKKDYFDEKSQVKKKQEEFVRFLKKGDPMATKVFKQNKENMKSSLSFIEDMVMDYNKKNHFEAFKIFSTAVNDVEMKDSKSAERSGNFIKSKIHNNSQKYSLAIYSAIRKQKFNNYKDVHKDVDELISKNEGFSSDAQRKAAFANGYEEKGKKKNESVNEGKKRYYQKDGIGKSKYTISYHDGKKKHKDGSDFFDIQIFRNKKDLAKFVNSLHKGGYVYGFGESVNERMNPKFYDARVQWIDPKYKKKFVGDVVRYDNGEYKVNLGKDGRFEKYILAKEKDLKIVSKSKKKTFESVNEWDSKSIKAYGNASAKAYGSGKASKLAMGIAGLTGTRGSAVQDFINKNRINSKKLFKALKSANLQGRINFASALSGRPGNPNAKLTIKLFGESVNEGKYNYKADALTAYFKGKIDAKELDRIARDDFKSGIATKKELSNFLSNKFTQDVMSDTYGIPAGTLIKRVRGLMKFAEGVDIVDQAFLKAKPVKEKEDGVPQGYNPMVEDKKQIKDLVKKVKFEKLFYDVLDTMEKKYGKRKYRIWLEKSLKDFGVNPKHYDYRTNAGAEEKLFQLGK